MKPTKNRVYCRDCGRVKMLFETEKQADTFIRFNREEIEERAGYCSARSYFCIICNGWHVTSKKEHGHLISKSEKILGDYKTMKLQLELRKEERKRHTDELLQDLKNQIGIIEKAFKDGKFEYCKEIIDSVLQKLKKIQGRNEEKKRIRMELERFKPKFI